MYEGWLIGEQPGEDVHVAIKAMKPLGLAQARQFFQEEAITLAMLHQHFSKEQEEAKKPPPRISPLYYGRGEYEDTPLLVVEFVEGREVAELLQRASGRLPEEQALTIGWQLFYLLDVLHTQLKKTFVDLKFEDLWWVDGEGETPGQLKILDFGTLEEIKSTAGVPDGVKRDLLLGGVYLCYLITGQQPAYSMMGYLRKYREADEIIRQGEMSWGTREWLYKLLHRNPQMRPTSANEVAAALRELAGFWTQPLPMLLKAARGLLGKVETMAEDAEKSQVEDINHWARRVRAALSIAALRDPQDKTIQQDIERADHVLNLSDFMKLGKMALMARAFDLARQRFEEGMQWGVDPTPLRRWAYLARVGEEISPSVFEEHQEQAFQMVEWLNEGDWEHGLERLEQLRPYLQSPGLGMLYADAQLSMALEESASARDKRRYSQAAQALRKALEWLEKLPDADFIVREEIGDLYLQVREVENLAKTEEQAAAGMQQAKNMLQQPQPPWGEVV
ncbi:hypothetical protein D6833_10965, partial [Candidatus Parcubacteria bacterium]